MRRSTRGEPEDRAFAERLRKLRQERGWTQYELAERAEVDRSVIANYEQGVSYPPVPVLRRLSLALTVSVDQLIFEEPASQQGIQDRRLWEIFQKVDQMDYRTKDIVKEMVEGLLAKKELEDLRDRPRKKTGT